MAKVFFLGLFVILIGMFGLLFAYQLNMLPDPALSFINKTQRSFSFLNSSVPPSLEKFEGTWSITFIPARTETEVGTCTIARSLVHAHAGVFTGRVGTTGSTLAFSAKTTDEGRMTGTIGGTSSVRKGTLSANFVNGEAQGVWKDEYECNGTLVLTKQDSVIDPIQGRVVSASSDSSLAREGTVRPLLPGMVLYIGDMVETNGGSVLLGMGVDFGMAVNLPPSTTYKVGQ